ncbi:hypothetical protein SSS_09651 [Sarcoptes scabiei]|uniref:ORC1/DEAH AAA+ ATPase domain-containing protein n=1 Tax=Sarcoptes scabiei TaxID=52283 RepID=A0A834RK16_SARSC|nr:hypothetical protein SSS_09651 [Sarcoptes scabiei]
MQLKSILPNLMVCGPPATGKTTIIRLLADRLKIFYIWFDCNTYDHNERLFYAKILLQMGKKIDSLHEELNLISNDDENNLSYFANFIEPIERMKKCDSDYTYNAGQLFVKFQPYINQISSQMNGEAIVVSERT